jgi:Domain of unknown function (DUF6265)
MQAFKFITVALALLSGHSQAVANKLDALAWLSGCWFSTGGESGSGEFWLPAAGDRMLGIGRTISAGKTVQYEFLSVHVGAAGMLVYTAEPSRQQRTEFVATDLGDRTATFENHAHDFPQRIRYQLTSDSELQVVIDGLIKKKRRSMKFAFRRGQCPA